MSGSGELRSLRGAPATSLRHYRPLQWTVEKYARRLGVDIVGFGDVTEALPHGFEHLPTGISLGVVDPVMRLLVDGGEVGFEQAEEALYDHRDLRSQARLEVALHGIAELLRVRGYRYFCFVPDCDPMESPFTSLLTQRFSHKAAATCAGLGSVGRHGLLNHPRFGPHVAWATLVTDAPFEVGTPFTESHCQGCGACVRACPAGAISGRVWRREDGMHSLVDADKCRLVLEENERHLGRRICGRCAVACAMLKLGREGARRLSPCERGADGEASKPAHAWQYAGVRELPGAASREKPAEGR